MVDTIYFDTDSLGRYEFNVAILRVTIFSNRVIFSKVLV